MGDIVRRDIEGNIDPQFDEDGKYWMCRFCSGFDMVIDPVISSQGPDEENFDEEEHDIIVDIAALIGDSPKDLAIAEKIFNRMKYRITRYVLCAEYNKKYPLSMKLLMWIESKIYPIKANKLLDFVKKFF